MDRIGFLTDDIALQIGLSLLLCGMLKAII